MLKVWLSLRAGSSHSKTAQRKGLKEQEFHSALMFSQDERITSHLYIGTDGKRRYTQIKFDSALVLQIV